MNLNNQKIVQINATSGRGSTGKICTAISKLLDKEGVENYVLYSLAGDDRPNSICFSWEPIRKLQAFGEKLFGNYGFGAWFTTWNLLRILRKINPTIIHLHNIHSHDVHLGMLFHYIEEHNIKVFWTFHDCWAFTGYCMYFDMVQCEKWTISCKNCPRKKEYSLLWDLSDTNLKKKSESVKKANLTVITPSRWLKELAIKSILKPTKITTINNGVNLSLFTKTVSDLRNTWKCQNKIIVLGVANIWEERKGLDIFLRLHKDLAPEKYQIVLVGTTERVDKLLPPGIISIHRTSSVTELAQIYTTADVLVNPTREDNFPTVNIEALACGTPVVTFDTGGSPEMLSEGTGIIVPSNDYIGILNAIEELKVWGAPEMCIKQSLSYDENRKFNDYVNLYKQ
ncbi:MAG: glycosyltransferase [Bacteroidales bacterium]|nr:glycosyltransferase [Bacteroidales bacterium]